MSSNSMLPALIAVSLLNFNCGLNSNSLHNRLWHSWKITKERLIVRLGCWLWEDKVFLLSSATSWLCHAQLCSFCVFQVSIYIMQIIFGAVDFPSKLVALAALSYLGRRYSQAACLFLSALVIFINIFIPAGDLCTSIQNKVTSLMSRCWTSAGT